MQSPCLVTAGDQGRYSLLLLMYMSRAICAFGCPAFTRVTNSSTPTSVNCCLLPVQTRLAVASAIPRAGSSFRPWYPVLRLGVPAGASPVRFHLLSNHGATKKAVARRPISGRDSSGFACEASAGCKILTLKEQGHDVSGSVLKLQKAYEIPPSKPVEVRPAKVAELTAGPPGSARNELSWLKMRTAVVYSVVCLDRKYW
jgi:hypothetical protein